MVSKKLIELFNTFKKETGKYNDLNIEDVHFENVALGDKDYFILNPKKTEIDKKLIASNVSVSFIPLKSIDPTIGRCNTSIIKPIAELINSYTYFAENDVIFTKVTPSMENGNIAVAENLENGIGFGSSEYYIFRSTKVYNKYLWHFMRQKSFREAARVTMKGAGGLQRVPKEFFDTAFISVPRNLSNNFSSFQLQQIIVEFLNYQKDQTHQLREKMSFLKDKANQTEETVLNKLFEMKDDFIVNQFNKWAQAKSYNIDGADITFDIKRIISDNSNEMIGIKKMGFTPTRDPEGDTNWFSVSDLTKVDGLYINEPYTKEKTTMELIKKAVDKKNTGKSEKLIPIKKGDILISFKLTVGVVKIYNSDEPAYCNEAIDIITVNKNFINEYIAYNCIIEYPKYGTQTNNGLTLNDDSKKEIEIKTPNNTGEYTSIEVQEIIVEFIKAFNLWRNTISILTTSVQEKSNTLDSALLQEIFKGSADD